MKNLQEQTKQKIVLELEHARLWTSFLLALFAVLISVLFTNLYIDVGHAIERYVWGLLILGLIVAVTVLRKKCISRVKKYINNLR